MLKERSTNSTTKCLFYNSFFYTLYQKGYARVRRWSTKVVLFFTISSFFSSFLFLLYHKSFLFLSLSFFSLFSFFLSFFSKSLEQANVDIFEMDKVIFPVHLGNHWCTAVINLRDKKFEYYDSMGSPNYKCIQV